MMAELWVGSGGGVLLEPPERRSCRKHHLQSSRGLLLQFLTFAKLADLVACFAIPAAAALLAVYPPSARWAHAATFSLLFTGVDSRGQLALRRVLGQAGHVKRAVRQKHSSRRHDEKPRVEGETTPYSIWEVNRTTYGVCDRRTLQVASPRACVSTANSHSHAPRQEHVLHTGPL